VIHENDIASLKAWKKIITETFAVNLAGGARLNIGSRGKFILDHDYDTYWTTRKKDTTAVIELKLNVSKTFDVLLLQENITVGQRIEKFVLEYQAGNQWKTIITGTTVGYKRLIRFDPVTASKVRLRILSSRLNPTLSEFGLYKQAEP
jgi:alpha-L-fucosidase